MKPYKIIQKVMPNSFLGAKIVIFAFLSVLALLPVNQAEAAIGNFLYKLGQYLDYPTVIAIDGNGNVYVTDQTYRVQVFDSTGTFTREWGSFGTGDGQFNSIIKDIAVDGSGNVYVAESSRIQVFTSTGEFIRKWGSYGTGDGQFNGITELELDGSGNVYTLECGSFNHRRVQVFTSTGEFIRKWGSFGGYDWQLQYPTSMAVDGSGNVYIGEQGLIKVFASTGTFIRKWGSYGTGDGQFQSPQGMAIDGSGNVYVADTLQSRIEVFTSTGTFITKWGPYKGSGDGVFQYPQGIAIDGGGNIYVADTNNHRIQFFTDTGTFLGKWGTITWPYGIAVDVSGDVYIVDRSNNRVQVLSSTGTLIREWGSSGTGDGQLQNPTYIAIDVSGNVYVADTGNSRIQVFTSTGEFIRKWGVPGPYGIAVDVSGNVYVVDSGNDRVQVFTSTGEFVRQWGSRGGGDGQFNYPAGLSVDGSGNVYVADWANARIQVFASTGGFVRQWGSAGTGEGQFRNPTGIAVDRSGIVYVVDYVNNRIQVFTSTGEFITRWGYYGTQDGRFNYPYGIALDENRNVYVADTGNNRIQVFEGYSCNASIGASAGPYQTVEQSSLSGADVVLYGSGFPAECGVELTYDWSWQGGSASGVNPTVFMPVGTTNVTLTVSDGSSSATDTVAITVQDTQKPNTTATLTGTTGDSDWFTSDVNVSLTAMDSGSGVKEIHYSMDGDPETVISGSSAAINLTGEGAHSVTYFAQDNALNSETPNSASIRIDKTKPNVMAAPSPSANVAGWNNVDVTVTFDCADTTSGISACAPPVSISAEGFAQTVNGIARDNAGNSSGTSINLNIDKTPPEITITGITDGAAYILGSVPVAGYTTTDPLSGIESESETLTGGNANNVGAYMYTVTATDRAGNARTVSATYTVIYNFSGFLSTTPVKFQLTDAQGGYFLTANATVMLQQYADGVPVGGAPIPATSSNGSGNTCRYDAESNQYIYNLNTRVLAPGEWQIIVGLDDGSVNTAFITVK